jgi:hypothetical protein
LLMEPQPLPPQTLPFIDIAIEGVVPERRHRIRRPCRARRRQSRHHKTSDQSDQPR